MIALLTLLAASAAHDAHRCAMPGGDLVPNSQVAREIGAAILRGRQGAEESARYEIRVEAAGNDAWAVLQLVPDRIEADGSVTHTDGGGVAIRIDRCNGAVLSFQPLI